MGTGRFRGRRRARRRYTSGMERRRNLRRVRHVQVRFYRRGEPQGHFVVLRGYNPATRRVSVADPLRDNPFDEGQYYQVGIDRLMGALLLGIVTYDANLLVLRPGRDAGDRGEE